MDQFSAVDLVGGTPVTLSTSGEYHVWVGGAVTPLATTTDGEYTGTVTVQVAYDTP